MKRAMNVAISDQVNRYFGEFHTVDEPGEETRMNTKIVHNQIEKINV